MSHFLNALICVRFLFPLFSSSIFYIEYEWQAYCWREQEEIHRDRPNKRLGVSQNIQTIMNFQFRLIAHYKLWIDCLFDALQNQIIITTTRILFTISSRWMNTIWLKMFVNCCWTVRFTRRQYGLKLFVSVVFFSSSSFPRRTVCKPCRYAIDELNDWELSGHFHVNIHITNINTIQFSSFSLQFRCHIPKSSACSVWFCVLFTLVG